MNLRPLPPQLAIYTRSIYENRMLFLIIFGCLPLFCLDFELSSALNYVRGIWLEVNGFSRFGANFQTVRTGFLHQKNRAPSSFCLSGAYYIIFFVVCQPIRRIFLDALGKFVFIAMPGCVCRSGYTAPLDSPSAGRNPYRGRDKHSSWLRFHSTSFRRIYDSDRNFRLR